MENQMEMKTNAIFSHCMVRVGPGPVLNAPFMVTSPLLIILLLFQLIYIYRGAHVTPLASSMRKSKEMSGWYSHSGS